MYFQSFIIYSSLCTPWGVRELFDLCKTCSVLCVFEQPRVDNSSRGLIALRPWFHPNNNNKTFRFLLYIKTRLIEKKIVF